jgi:hypothetical protein
LYSNPPRLSNVEAPGLLRSFTKNSISNCDGFVALGGKKKFKKNLNMKVQKAQKKITMIQNLHKFCILICILSQGTGTEHRFIVQKTF